MITSFNKHISILCLIAGSLLYRLEGNSTQTSAFRVAYTFSGPSETYQQIGTLNPGVSITIIERNEVGTWVHINRLTEDGLVAIDGWVISGYLNRSTDLHFGTIPINAEIQDSNPSAIKSRSMAKLASEPVIPQISDEMVLVYKRGQQLGNLPDVITKVGDSLSASEQYLKPMSRNDNQLGPYDYLQDTLEYYGHSTDADSIAAKIGLTTYAVFDPFWADKERCEAKESPLDCEYRLKKPSIAFIMFGPNDVRHMKVDDYNAQMRKLIEQTLNKGIIPVVSTFSAHPDEAFFWQSINFNLELVALSHEYKFPLINLWLAARVLPTFGLDDDKIHLKPSGFMNLKYDTGHEAFYGISLHNLLCLRSLSSIKDKLGLENSL
jgi:hypothetical protein